MAQFVLEPVAVYPLIPRPVAIRSSAVADMAFAAIHPEAGRIDATLPDLGCGLAWGSVYKVRPRIALRCPECGHGVHAKLSPFKLRYFAHDPGRPADCSWLNESLEHHLLKLELATAIRTVGWHAQMEVRAADGTWRADVLAFSADGTRRVAWEAQLSPITHEDIHDRTSRYQAEGIGVCWVGVAERLPWMGVVPSIQVCDPHGERPWTVVDGVAGFDYEDGVWSIVDDLPLITFIRWVLHGQTITHRILPRYRRIWHGDQRRYTRRQTIWTTPRSISSEARHDAMRQRQEAWKQQQEERERQAEQRRQEEAEARRREEERQRAIRQEAERARAEELRRKWAAEAEQRRPRREAELRQQQELDRAAERERLQQEQREQQAARIWWDDLSSTQLEQFRAAVTGSLRKKGLRVEFDSEGPTVENAYGIAIYQRYRRYGVLRPSPASMHRLPSAVPVFVRNAREAQQIIDTEKIDPGRVIHFDLPDGEQLLLL
ncbi:competence protein CoiA family protein [Frankia tisae]|uniref:competence protein CoiA family protein n=1 Tax=Frankia tisae TaxID=2950104 RepID=UPI0021BE567F|nr:competence protein CoiA family protein [Frankia tisae]